jgi:hypothetical protein
LRFNYTEVDEDEMQGIWDFYMARKGSHEAFYIYDFMTLMDHESLFCGTGDGSTSTFDIPGRSTSSHSLYIDGVDQPSGWEVFYGGGDGGSDEVAFSVPPSDGEDVTIDFTGYLRIRCRFADDNLSRRTLLGIAFGFGISLKGLKDAE